MPTYDTILYDKQRHGVLITLNRPELNYFVASGFASVLGAGSAGAGAGGSAVAVAPAAGAAAAGAAVFWLVGR